MFRVYANSAAAIIANCGSGRGFAAAAVMLVLAGCAAMSEQACLTSDWRTVGFEDGSLGRAEATIGNYRKACAEHGVTPDLEAYRAGHAEGVLTYCKPGNGFEVGHSGAAYQGVCPANLEEAFVAEYNTGRHLHDLEWALQRVDSEIASNYREQENIRGELTRIGASMIANDTTSEQRLLMVSRSAELGRRYGELTAQTKSLEEERVVHALELRDFQQTLASRF
jgi:uncharacterized protein DUF2799